MIVTKELATAMDGLLHTVGWVNFFDKWLDERIDTLRDLNKIKIDDSDEKIGRDVKILKMKLDIYKEIKRRPQAWIDEFEGKKE